MSLKPNPPPTYAEIILPNNSPSGFTFNPIWLRWLLDLSQQVASGTGGTSGATGAAGPAGPAITMVADYQEADSYPMPGIPGPAGAAGAAGKNGFGFDGVDGEDGIGYPGAPGPAGSAGVSGTNGINGFGFDGADGEDGLPIPGPVGASGSIGLTGAQGPVGPAVYLEAEVIESDMFVIPGINGTIGVNGIAGIPGLDGQDGEDGVPIPGQPGPAGTGATGAQGPAGPAVYLEADVIEPDLFIVPGPQGPAGTSGGGASPKGTATIDFGAFPGSSDTSVAITGQTTIVSGSVVIAQIYPIATADHSADEHFAETLFVTAGNIVPGTGFTIYARNSNTLNEPVDYPPNANTIVSSTAGTAIATKNAQPGARAYGGGQGTRIYGQWTVAWTWN